MTGLCGQQCQATEIFFCEKAERKRVSSNKNQARVNMNEVVHSEKLFLVSREMILAQYGVLVWFLFCFPNLQCVLASTQNIP